MTRKEDIENGKRNCNDDNERKVAMLMNEMVLFGGPDVGFNTNPETEKRSCFIEICGEKIVCIAQGGECRYNHRYYSPGLNDRKSWTTPIVDNDCPTKCCYKVLVCDGHDKKCEGSITYYPQYNKFRGQFTRYCRNFDKFINQKMSDNENVGKEGEEADRRNKREISKRYIKIGIIHGKGKNGEEITRYYH